MLQFEDVGSVFNSIGSSQASTSALEDSKSNQARMQKRKEQDYDDEDEQPEQMVSDNASVSTSIMDKLSSIFSIRGAAAPNVPKPPQKQRSVA
mmetsp:Transcript_14161/g.19259  ORF Transcript_14161/g.19259 Transcript_14161/m.19259 type:complete len:93 (+) Transcript_14161:375-653(+)|eukprot:CAMPEP_0170468130 /NCGR_PEP_ID=MMETSP0123-20130129/11428_1 /TAXON_ID=182087 /ORGANISM="Favella ehrenbergii, Strain Fehren 1" /LENGTH=92 /DNA_ID=CAMNT_0010734627 /DNA_START=1766 /DNA_END=2044 /DNA_ORIENTATION=+